MTTTSNLIKGIDVSNIQQKVDWQSVANAGYKFCIIRCGIGNDGIDNLYKTNVAGANACGLKTAAYNVVYPLPTIPSQPLRDPSAQAQYHFEAVAGLVSVVSIDLEFPTPQDWKNWNCSASQIVDWTTTYMEAYTKLSGITPLCYSYPSFLSAVNFPASFCETYKLWIASYTENPVSVSGWGSNYTLWQASGGAINLPNSNVPVDLDYAKDLSLWGVQETQTSSPTPSIPSVNTLPTTNTPSITISAPPDTTPAMVQAPPDTSTQPTPTVSAPNPTTTTNPSPTLITEVETVLKNNPGILTTIGTFVAKIFKVLLSIK